MIGKFNSGVVHLNRRIRNRTYGGVGGRRERLLLLPDPIDSSRWLSLEDLWHKKIKKHVITDIYENY